MRFLTIQDLEKIHTYQIKKFGADGGSELRGDGERLRKVVESIQEFDKLAKTPAEKAMQYMIWFRSYEPYWDGNRRTGTMAALVFLRLNGYTFTDDPHILACWTDDFFRN